MKQHINEKDLEQLDQSQINKLNDLMLDDCIDNYYLDRWLTIGKMIEILGREKTGRVIMREWNDNTDLCDALWMAVKDVL